MSRIAPIAKPSALALTLVLSPLACSSSPQQGLDMASPTSDMAGQPLLVIAGSDYTSGALSTVDPASRAVTKNLDGIDPMAAIRAFGSKVYVLDQTHGALRTYDATQSFKNPVDSPISKTGVVNGAQANPHDIYIDAPRKLAYVTLYGSATSPEITNNHAIGVIDLTAPAAGISRFIPVTQAPADPDNNPEADRLVACGDSLYVVLQDLDRTKGYVASGPGRLAVLSLSNPGTPSYIQLAGQNPTALTVLPGCTQAIVGSGADQYSGMQTGLGGIEIVNLMGMQTMGLALKDKDLGGNVSTLDAIDAAHVFADLQVKAGSGFANTIYAVDAVAKTKGAALLGPFAYAAAVRVLDDKLVVLSGTAAAPGQLPAGLYLGATSGAPLTDPALDVGLPPQSLALVYR